MHSNDTLCGTLLYHERPEEAHLRGAFGYWRMVENRAIREMFLCYGIEPEHYTISHVSTAIHKHDITFQESSRAFSARATRNYADFTDEELSHLAEHFAMANDPVSISIAVKAMSRLKGFAQPSKS